MHTADIDERTIRDAVAHLGALPMSMTRLATITGAPDFDFADVVEVVERDMVLAGGVLRVANSAESSTSSRVETVREAVVRIGAARTLAAAMHTVVGRQLQEPLGAYGIAPGELGRHSSGAWIAGELIRTAVRSSIHLPASVGTAALLHDVGKLVCNAVAVEHGFDDCLADASPADLCEAERAVFGLDHGEAGAIVATSWNLPPAIVTGVRDHHHAIDDPIPIAVALADDFAHAVADGEFPDAAATGRRALVLGMPDDDLGTIVEETRRRLEAFATAGRPS